MDWMDRWMWMDGLMDWLVDRWMDGCFGWMDGWFGLMVWMDHRLWMDGCVDDLDG